MITRSIVASTATPTTLRTNKLSRIANIKETLALYELQPIFESAAVSTTILNCVKTGMIVVIVFSVTAVCTSTIVLTIKLAGSSRKTTNSKKDKDGRKSTTQTTFSSSNSRNSLINTRLKTLVRSAKKSSRSL